MSEQLAQQYEREDMLPDTPAQAIESYQAKTASLAHIVPEVAQKLEETGALLYQAQEAAKARGDLGAVEQIGIAWSNTERMAMQVVQIDSANAAAGEVIKVMDSYRRQAVEEKTNLETAIFELSEDGDTDHPALSALKEDLHDHWLETGFHTDCPGCEAMNLGWADALDHDDVNDLFRALMSPYFVEKIPTEMRESLGQFLRPWLTQWNEYLDELERQEKAADAAMTDEYEDDDDMGDEFPDGLEDEDES